MSLVPQCLPLSEVPLKDARKLSDLRVLPSVGESAKKCFYVKNIPITWDDVSYFVLELPLSSYWIFSEQTRRKFTAGSYNFIVLGVSTFANLFFVRFILLKVFVLVASIPHFSAFWSGEQCGFTRFEKCCVRKCVQIRVTV